MKKLLDKTKVDIKITHDRLTLKACMKNGGVLKYRISRSSESFTFDQIKELAQISKTDGNKILSFLRADEFKGETIGQRFERLSKYIENYNSIESLIIDLK